MQLYGGNKKKKRNVLIHQKLRWNCLHASTEGSPTSVLSHSLNPLLFLFTFKVFSVIVYL